MVKPRLCAVLPRSCCCPPSVAVCPPVPSKAVGPTFDCKFDCFSMFFSRFFSSVQMASKFGSKNKDVTMNSSIPLDPIDGICDVEVFRIRISTDQLTSQEPVRARGMLRRTSSCDKRWWHRRRRCLWNYIFSKLVF